LSENDHLERVRKLIQFLLGNYLRKIETDADRLSDDDLEALAGKAAALSEALDYVEAAESGTTVYDLGVGAQTVEEYRTRAIEYNGENLEND